MLELKTPGHAGLLEESLLELIKHHDVLRLRCAKQRIAAVETHKIFTCVDAQIAEIEKCANEAQSSLDLNDGPIIRAVYFDLGDERSHRLLIVIHHLAVDGVSWRILLDDMRRACEKLRRGGGGGVKLPPKTVSFGRWAGLLAAHAQTAAVREELDYWTAEPRRRVGKLPV